MRELHEKLVVGGLVEQADFWRSQGPRLKAREQKGGGAAAAAQAAPSASSASSASALASAAAASSGAAPGGKGQRPGSSSCMLDVLKEIKATMPPGATVPTITPQLVQRIFAMRPAVAAAHAQSVPAAMSEVEFWTRFYRHEQHKAARRALKASQFGLVDSSQVGWLVCFKHLNPLACRLT